MAGEELQKNKTLQERFGEDYVNNVKGEGLQDATNKGKYSRKELASEFRYGRGDTSVDDTVAKYQGMVDSGEFKGNNRAQEFLKGHGISFGGGGNKSDNTSGNTSGNNPPGNSDPISGGDGGNGGPNTNYPGITGSQNQVSQDNDITTDINGDNNVVTNKQDNSIRQYGGNTKVFNYQGGKNGGLYDSPVSAGTMGGFFHDEDSPGSTAAFVDRYSTQNSDMQKKYSNPGIAQVSIANAKNNKSIDSSALDQRIQARSKASRARSTSMAGDIFGDMFNYSPGDYKSPDAPDPIKTPNFGK